MVAFKADASLAKEGLVLSLRAYEQSVQGRRGGGEHKNELDSSWMMCQHDHLSLSSLSRRSGTAPRGLYFFSFASPEPELTLRKERDSISPDPSPPPIFPSVISPVALRGAALIDLTMTRPYAAPTSGVHKSASPFFFVIAATIRSSRATPPHLPAVHADSIPSSAARITSLLSAARIRSNAAPDVGSISWGSRGGGGGGGGERSVEGEDIRSASLA